MEGNLFSRSTPSFRTFPLIFGRVFVFWLELCVLWCLFSTPRQNDTRCRYFSCTLPKDRSYLAALDFTFQLSTCSIPPSMCELEQCVCVCVCGWNRKEGSEKEMNRNGRPRTKRSNRFGNGSFNVVHLVTSIQPRRHSNQFLMKINTTARGEVGSSGEETTARLLNKINSRLVHARNRISII